MTLKVVFYSVKSTESKLMKITQVAQKHFEKKDPLLFLVPDQASWDFLDRLLWTTPIESFIPHPSTLIQISSQVDPAFTSIFNLCASPLLQPGPKTIYDLEDHTSKEKYSLFEKRYQAYREHSLQIIIEL